MDLLQIINRAVEKSASAHRRKHGFDQRFPEHKISRATAKKICELSPCAMPRLGHEVNATGVIERDFGNENYHDGYWYLKNKAGHYYLMFHFHTPLPR